MSSVLANQLVSMYGMLHLGSYEFHQWHVLVAYVITTWMCCGVVLFGNKILPQLNTLGMFLSVGGVVVTLLVCAIMPSVTGSGYNTGSFVWKDFDNETGWTSDGFVFLSGMLNGAFAVGTTDCVTHVAEELPR